MCSFSLAAAISSFLFSFFFFHFNAIFFFSRAERVQAAAVPWPWTAVVAYQAAPEALQVPLAAQGMRSMRWMRRASENCVMEYRISISFFWMDSCGFLGFFFLWILFFYRLGINQNDARGVARGMPKLVRGRYGAFH
jgi:hypothetical protein